MKQRVIVLCVIIMTVLMILILSNGRLVKEPAVISPLIEMGVDDFRVANNRQYKARVWLAAYHGDLYFYTHNRGEKKTRYDHWLCQLSKNKVHKICKLAQGSNIHIIGSTADYLYYWTYDGYKDNHDKLYCFDFANQVEKQLYIGKASYLQGASYFVDNNTVYIPLNVNNGEDSKYLKVNGTETEVLSLAKGYKINEIEYTILNEYGSVVERIQAQSANGECNELPLGAAKLRTILPVPDKLIIHNEGMNSLLYFIDNKNQLNELFKIECLVSDSAVNIWNNEVYISIKRFEKFGRLKLGMLRYANDEIEGTYRIDLASRTITKISDSIYNALYNIDDTCLYACDEEANVYMIDRSGRIISMVIKY